MSISKESVDAKIEFILKSQEMMKLLETQIENAKKEAKKAPQKTLKEKRQQKKEKKS